MGGGGVRRYSVVVLELNWEGDVELPVAKPVHHALYLIGWARKEAGTEGADELLEDMVNYGLFKEEVKKSGKVRLVEMQKKTRLEKWLVEEGGRLIVKRRSTKPSVNRKLDEDIFKDMFMSRMAKRTDVVEPGMRKEERVSVEPAIRSTRRGKRESSTRSGAQRLQSVTKKQKVTMKSSLRGKSASGRKGERGRGGELTKGRGRGERESTKRKKLTDLKSEENTSEVSEKKLEKIRAGREKRMEVRKRNLSSSSAFRSGARQWGTLPELTLAGIFRCHSKNEQNFRKDFATPVYCCCFLPVLHTHGRVIACTGGGHKICFIDCLENKVVRIFQAAPTEAFFCVASTALEKDGQRVVWIACGGKEGTVKLIDYFSKECFAVLRGHEGSVNALSFSPSDPNVLITGSSDKSLIMWDVVNRTQLARFDVNMRIYTLDISPAGHDVIYGGTDNSSREYGYGLWSLRKEPTGEFAKEPWLSERNDSNATQYIDCVRFVNDFTIAVKRRPKGDIEICQLSRDLSGTYSIVQYMLTNKHMMKEDSAYQFYVDQKRMCLYVGDNDGAVQCFQLQSGSNAFALELNASVSPSQLYYHPQCVDYILQVVSCVDLNGDLYLISTGSMNYVYLWKETDAMLHGIGHASRDDGDTAMEDEITPSNVSLEFLSTSEEELSSDVR